MKTKWLTSKNGHPVPVVNGISLCSMFDPQKEARKWFESYKDIVNDFDHIFVLGVGGGYHIDLLLAELPGVFITVIEQERDLLIGLASKILGWGDRVAVLSDPSVAQIKEYESYHCVFEQASYCVLVHPTSYVNSKEYYKKIEEFLLGRSPEGLAYINTIKGRKNAYFDNFQDKYGLTGDESIKDIVNRIQNNGNSNMSDEDLIWMSLGELIH